MTKILVVSGHTDLANSSIANKEILHQLEKRLPNAQFDYLSELYPDYEIDIPKEQQKLLDADVIVLQYPLFWYSVPSILQRWMEQSFAFEFSHGNDIYKLKGKKIVLSITVGAEEEEYTIKNAIKIDTILDPLKNVCKFCQLDYIGEVVTYGISYQIREENSKEIEKKAINHAERVVGLISNT